MLYLLILAGTAAVFYAWHRYLIRTWKAAGHRLGLSFHRGGLLGEVEGCTVQARILRRPNSQWGNRQGNTYLQVTVEGAQRISTDIRFKPKTLKASAAQLITGKTLPIGDPVFDSKILIEGSPVMLHAVLNANARAQSVTFFSAWTDAELSNGQLIWEGSRYAVSGARLERLILDMLKTVQVLGAPKKGSSAALLESVKHEPLATVRLGCLVQLAALGGLQMQQAAPIALNDPSPQIRALAALKTDDVPTLCALIDDPSTPTPHAVRALDRLADLDVDAALSRIERILTHRPSPLTPAALHLAAALNHAPATAWIARQMISTNAEVLIGVVAVIEALSGVQTQSRLLRILSRTEAGVAEAALAALGRTGDLSAVRALREFGHQNRVLKSEVDDAVRWIQNTRARGPAGGLALANEGIQGQLAMVETPGGLSLTEEN